MHRVPGNCGAHDRRPRWRTSSAKLPSRVARRSFQTACAVRATERRRYRCHLRKQQRPVEPVRDPKRRWRAAAVLAPWNGGWRRAITPEARKERVDAAGDALPELHMPRSHHDAHTPRTEHTLDLVLGCDDVAFAWNAFGRPKIRTTRWRPLARHSVPSVTSPRSGRERDDDGTADTLSSGPQTPSTACAPSRSIAAGLQGGRPPIASRSGVV
jgi:hypothetical protein